MTERNSTIKTKKKQRTSKNSYRGVRLTQAEFLELSRKAHGDFYGYDKAVYVNSTTKVTIKCPEHGYFEQRAGGHVKGRGCRKCFESRRRSNTGEFIKKARAVHGDRYDYSLVDYKGALDKVTVICREHGEIKVTPKLHLMGVNCKKCKGVARSNVTDFVAKARAIHGDKYNYSRVDYKNSGTKVDIVCREHGVFQQTPNSHLRGANCPRCVDRLSGWSRSNFVERCSEKNGGSGTLYVIKCFGDNEEFYKVGITSNSTRERFGHRGRIPYKFSIKYEVVSDASYIYDIENRIHSLLRDNRHEPSIDFDGSTECFTTIKPVEKLIKELQSTEQLQLLA